MTIGDLIRPRGIFRDTGTESREKERGWTSQEETRTVEGGRDEEEKERERERRVAVCSVEDTRHTATARYISKVKDLLFCSP